ncbi:MAG: hypothetical protein OEM81_02635, partial [Acidimicrobiia bacterium]|nr:hypothetical protein [Acidimicrobiia bacterium]
MAVRTETASLRRPSPALRWVRENLFNNWYNSVLTVIFGALFIWVGFSLLRWVFFRAEWEIVR